MLWFLTVPVIGFFVFKNLIEGDWLMLDGGRDFWQWPFLGIVFTIFFGCFITAFISAFPLGFAAYLGSLPEVIGVQDTEYPLVALREKDGMSGNFFLGSGTIRDVQYYFWYRRNSNGSISGGKTYREPGVEIRETEDGSTPKMVTFKTQYVSPNIAGVLWWVALDMRDETSWCPRFYIPKGSVKEGYTL
jgi:hypothetical protein